MIAFDTSTGDSRSAMIRRFVLPLLLLAGCANAPGPTAEIDPVTCAYMIAHTIPPSAERSGLLSDIAFSATACDTVAHGKYWAFEPGVSHRSRASLSRAYARHLGGDSIGTRREALRAWEQDELEHIPGTGNGLRESVTSLLLDVGAYDDLLDLLDARPRMRLAWLDNDGARAEIAGLAAADGDDAAAARAIRSGPTAEARERARCEANRGGAVAMARAGNWAEAR